MSSPEQPGSNPQDWQSPYSPPPTYPYGDGQYPYAEGQYGYEQPQPAQPYGGYYGPPYGYAPQPQGPKTHAIVALVISCILAVSCYVSLGGIAGAILSGIALGKADTQPQQARTLLKWTWISIGANVVLLMLGIGAAIVYYANGGR
ncbi:hypothetical protein J5X84_22900 [Streptosporangiaceae bacterium NEAU-GS5]|nr:hypothetical protein [Streptosporangiaceae bacterium NEAU-GS5]